MKFDFYVYIYRDPIDGTPVYIGKGKGNRAISHTWTKARTNDRLAKLISQRGSEGFVIEPEIVAHCSENNALLIEQALIKYYGRAELGAGPLFNSTDGGDGVSNPSSDVRAKQRLAQENRWGTSVYEFVNPFTNEEFKGTPVQLAAKLGVNQRQVHRLWNDNHVHSVAGWCLRGDEHKVNAYNHNYCFLNALTGEEYSGTISQLSKMIERSSSHVAAMVSGSQKHCSGWVIKGREAQLRPLVVNGLGHVKEIEFPWENAKATFQTKLAWATTPSLIAFWKKELGAKPGVGVRSLFKAMGRDEPDAIYLYERSFKRCRDGEFNLPENVYFIDFFDEFLDQNPEYREVLEFR